MSDAADAADQKRTYLTVWFILAFLTVIEVAVPPVFSAPYEQTLKMLLLVSLAISKALFVAFYFMHLKWEKPWLRWIAMMPVYLGIFTIILMLETVYR